jgi:hypothetical protein
MFHNELKYGWGLKDCGEKVGEGFQNDAHIKLYFTVATNRHTQ